MSEPTRIAACHVAPVFLSAKETTAKAVSLIHEAAENGAHLVVFPESYIPAFPVWSALRAPSENHELFRRMAAESVYADGDEIGAVRAAARQRGVLVSLGFSEKARGTSSATLWNANVLVGAGGEVLVHHRKLVPTFYEKLTWAPGDGHGLRVADTQRGRVGALICGENTNPLARYALAAQGEQIHISSWPPVWPTRMPPAAASEEAAQQSNGAAGGGVEKPPAARAANYDNVAANRTRAAAHCFEAKCFGVLCAGVLGADAVEAASSGPGPGARDDAVARGLQLSSRGATMFLDTTGALLPGFVVVRSSDGSDATTREQRGMLQDGEGILYADVDLDDCVEGKQYHDITGGYQRFDVFELKVDRTRREPVTFT
ncbi:carbon-nitrogen hydrolase [Hypoxylon sp. FL1284]|nr:carbon-nitrogen hydrolase [Hypoxylon sp. FL1284]